MTDADRRQPEPDGYLCERVRRALAADPRVGELGIDVRIVGDRAFLFGAVPTAERHDAITAVVAGLLPGHEVHNDVTVTPIGDGPRVETLP